MGKGSRTKLHTAYPSPAKNKKMRGMNRRHFIVPSPFFQRPAWGYPGLPAEINKDDSDPLGGQDRRGTSRRSWGRKGPPFRRGSLSSSPIFLDRHKRGRFTGDNHKRMREIVENGFGTSLDRILEHSPCCDRSKLDRALFQPIDPSIRPRLRRTARSPPPCRQSRFRVQQTGWPATFRSRQSRPLP